MEQVRHVSFDCDGTLYREQPEIKRVYRGVICNYLAELNRTSVDIVAERFELDLTQFKTKTATMRNYGLGDDEIHKLLDSVDVPAFISPDKRLAQSIEDIVEQGISMSIFTNNSEHMLMRILEKLGIDHHKFGFFITRGDVKPKPDQEGYERVKKISGYEGNQIMFVGDRKHADILPARRAGMHTCRVWAADGDSFIKDTERNTAHWAQGDAYTLGEVIVLTNELAEQSKGQ